MKNKWTFPIKLPAVLQPSEIMGMLRDVWGQRVRLSAFPGGIIYVPATGEQSPSSGDVVVVICENDAVYDRYMRGVAERDKPEMARHERKNEWVLNNIAYRYVPIGGDVRLALLGVRPRKIVLIDIFLTVSQWQFLISLFRDGAPNIESIFFL